tara:strand:+ start:317 stop:514 length:198 start_codon:yes stop_codon:yes gene_type:complete
MFKITWIDINKIDINQEMYISAMRYMYTKKDNKLGLRSGDTLIPLCLFFYKTDYPKNPKLPKFGE